MWFPFKFKKEKECTSRPSFGHAGYGFNNSVFTLVCIAHAHLFNLHPCWPSEISATLNSAALPWALQHLLVGKLPAAPPVPWKLMLWIMRVSRYLQVPWQMRALDFFSGLFMRWNSLQCFHYESSPSAVLQLECVHAVHPVHRSNHFCLPRTSITVMFRANKPFYRVPPLSGEGAFVMWQQRRGLSHLFLLCERPRAIMRPGREVWTRVIYALIGLRV